MGGDAQERTRGSWRLSESLWDPASLCPMKVHGASSDLPPNAWKFVHGSRRVFLKRVAVGITKGARIISPCERRRETGVQNSWWVKLWSVCI